MAEKICSNSCKYVDEVNKAIQAVKCGKDGQWRGQGGVCPHKLEDAVNHPKHYTLGEVECIDAIKAAVINLTGMESVLTAQIIKYVWRWKQKGGLQDLLKSEWYLKRLIREVKCAEQEAKDAKVKYHDATKYEDDLK